MKLLLIHTGGTIGMVRTAAGFAPAAGVVEHALAQILGTGASIDVRALTPLIDSAQATFADWNRIAQTIAAAHDSYDGFIVTHGTDTMAFTGAALCFALQGLARPVILTGSMVPLREPGSDAMGNLADAITAAQRAAPGVWFQFAGQLLHGARLRKVDSQAVAAFAAAPSPLPPLRTAKVLKVHPYAPAEIAILSMAPGGSAKAFAAALALCDGAILRVFGAGTVPNDPGIAAALFVAQKRGTPMIAVSQCATGGVHIGTYAAGNLLREAGVIGGGDMTAEAAFVKLTHALSLPDADRHTALESNLCGEFG
jgi:L-asparaginase